MRQHSPRAIAKKHSNYKAKERTISLHSGHWRRIREAFLSQNPLCFYCQQEGRVTPANTVDHFDNNGDNNDWNNYRACCASCHSRKTAGIDFGKRVSWGCDRYGIPLDPGHDWNVRKDH